jgi:sarcosine oxidase subunit alpha
MKALGRIEQHPILGTLEKRSKITFQFDNQSYTALENETIAAALLAAGIRTLRVQEEKGTPRGIYCNMGHCLECRVTVNGKAGVRACLTVVGPHMVVHSGQRLPIMDGNEVQR